MNAAELGIWVEISDPFGVRLAQLDEFLRLAYARTVNEVGVLTLDLAPEVGARLWRRDNRMSIWRHPVGGAVGLETETVWFMAARELILDPSGAWRYRIKAVSAADLLARRIVAYPADSPEASKSGAADDVMKAFVRENLGTLAAAGRDVSALLAVQPDVSLGPSITKGCAWRSLLAVLQEISASTAEMAQPVYFDVIAPYSGALEFRTYRGQRGTDRASNDGNQLILSPGLGTISDGAYTDSHIDEATVIYAAAQGEGEARSVVEASDAVRVGASPFGRMEKLRDARHVSTQSQLEAEADTALYAARARRVFRANIADAAHTRYGVHWRWGDRVLAEFGGETFACHISTISVTVEEGREEIMATLQSEAAL